MFGHEHGNRIAMRAEYLRKGKIAKIQIPSGRLWWIGRINQASNMARSEAETRAAGVLGIKQGGKRSAPRGASASLSCGSPALVAGSPTQPALTDRPLPSPWTRRPPGSARPAWPWPPVGTAQDRTGPRRRWRGWRRGYRAAAAASAQA